MANPYIGEIRMFGGTFAPRGYAFCSGQNTPISQNETLFQLIGTTYGGDGQSTFNLPDLRGRIPLHMGTGNGLTSRVIGETAGTEQVTLTIGQLPSHGHQPVANNVDPTNDAPASNTMPCRPKQAVGGNSAQLYTDPSKTPVAGDLKPMLAGIIGITGNSQPHDNMMPYLCINFIIALEGIYPSQN
ncbi:phage tail protein [Sphingomonas asaccharolytica]|uniref:phage tail protein n=1 Tax=Sphingomonas asaccharolytica TaxID=40681 RepID=UPI0008344D33|nr:tail fiber protein [Sphingomonas asaccharolytica]